jgi:DNA-binding CsgD family transcriptional regulator
MNVRWPFRNVGKALLCVMAAQFALASVFLVDFMIDVLGLRATPTTYTFREIMQLSGWFGLILGLILNGILLSRLIRRSQRLERTAQMARGAFQDLVDERFAEWGLSPSEKDVALMAIKGYSNSEIAGILGKAEGTVKAQCNAVFRKASVSGRAQLLSVFVEDMLGEPLLQPAEPDHCPAERRQSTA